ncbi:hypothetical protein PHAVU_005G099200 [Phaseolus vulgaris]|uniref:Uncharacterized protein n=1 Tax=Phaseolus vulgaris TaxID=3885 RepID=V7BXJ6_PHAVU|nr:hypothetical protein PHAVU_005G099200g [Phaseolus vulgaris]ESW21788.1 hypothetical protein PHAVU_005G099200g [Phaseolus vulgaris]
MSYTIRQMMRYIVYEIQCLRRKRFHKQIFRNKNNSQEWSEICSKMTKVQWLLYSCIKKMLNDLLKRS